MNWGRGIVIAFVGFAAIIATMVTISMKQDISLVAKDYYKQEIAYQDQIDRQENFNGLESKPFIKKESGQLVLIFPSKLAENVSDGSIHLFRPSAANEDQKWTLSLDTTGKQLFNLNDYSKGRWVVKLFWKNASGMEFYNEYALSI